jgi:glycosyltransferase involved in cell wall biosynthesis
MNPDNTPFLTIGLPFFNNFNTLEKAVKSVQVQSYKNWELILLNDGSTDASLAVAERLMQRDSRISLVNDGENKGLVARLNQVIDMGKGDYIARMDADDMMMPGKLERQMAVLMENPDIDVIDTGAYTINEQDEPVGIRGVEELDTNNKKKALKNVLLFHPTIIVKTAWYRKNKYSPEFFRSEDYELWCRTFDTTIFYRITEPLFLYREGNVNVKNYVASMRTFRKILRLYGPGVLTKSELQVEMLKTYLKSATYKVFAYFEMQHILTSKRNQKLTAAQQAEIKQVINRIKTAGESIPEGVMR